MDKSHLEKTSEFLFGVIVGLLNGGLDPASDCYHANDRDLVYMFGEKVKCRKFHYQSAKSNKVKAWIEDFYKYI